MLVPTAVETTANGSDNDLQREESAHATENSPAFLVDRVHANDVDQGTDSQ